MAASGSEPVHGSLVCSQPVGCEQPKNDLMEAGAESKAQGGFYAREFELSNSYETGSFESLTLHHEIFSRHIA